MVGISGEWKLPYSEKSFKPSSDKEKLLLKRKETIRGDPSAQDQPGKGIKEKEDRRDRNVQQILQRTAYVSIGGEELHLEHPGSGRRTSDGVWYHGVRN